MKIDNILIADDDTDDNEFFVGVIKQLYPDMSVMVAESKDELFVCLEQKIPNVLFLDSFIGMDSGVESIKLIREIPFCGELPVIMYTGSTDMKTIGAAFRAGATSYFVKPGSLNEMRELLATVLNPAWLTEAYSSKQYYNNHKFYDYTV